MLTHFAQGTWIAFLSLRPNKVSMVVFATMLSLVTYSKMRTFPGRTAVTIMLTLVVALYLRALVSVAVLYNPSYQACALRGAYVSSGKEAYSLPCTFLFLI